MKLRQAAPLVIAILCARSASATVPIQDIVERAKPSVVHLGIVDSDGEEIASGSGFVISDSGRVVTNFHVADASTRIVAVFSGDKKVEVIGVWAFDPKVDLAVLQLAAGTYQPLKLSHTAPKEGDEVIVIGSPHGLAGSASTGIVSAIREKGVKLGDKTYESWTLQISAPISHGSSGSPALNQGGDVVGVAVGVDEGGEALNFAIPAAKVESLIGAIRRDDRVKPLSTIHETGRSPKQNLAISAAALGVLAAVWWLVGRLFRKKNATGAHTEIEINQ